MTKMLAKLTLLLFAALAVVLPNTSLVLRQPAAVVDSNAQSGAVQPPPASICPLPRAASTTAAPHPVVTPTVQVDSAALLLLKQCMKAAERNQSRQIKQVKLISSPTQ